MPRTKGSVWLFAIVRSGACPLMVTLAVSLLRLGSVSFSPVLVAVFVIDPVVVTVAVMVSVSDPPLEQTIARVSLLRPISPSSTSPGQACNDRSADTE